MELNTYYTEEIVCPYCGHVHQNSFELTKDEDTMECENCNKEFEYVRNIEITYSTFPK